MPISIYRGHLHILKKLLENLDMPHIIFHDTIQLQQICLD